MSKDAPGRARGNLSISISCTDPSPATPSRSKIFSIGTFARATRGGFHDEPVLRHLPSRRPAGGQASAACPARGAPHRAASTGERRSVRRRRDRSKWALRPSGERPDDRTTPDDRSRDRHRRRCANREDSSARVSWRQIYARRTRAGDIVYESETNRAFLLREHDCIEIPVWILGAAVAPAARRDGEPYSALVAAVDPFYPDA